MIKVGDIVLPIDEREFLFSHHNEMAFEADIVEIFWDDIPGIVIKTLDFDPPREYYHIQISTGEVVGWTYSDFVELIS